MNSPQISRYRVLSFDCYGTLVDWERSIVEALGSPLRRLGREASDLQILTMFLSLEGDILAKAPSTAYSDVLFQVYGGFCEHHGLPYDSIGAELFASSIGEWKLFPDTQEALKFLAARHQLVILSNIDDRSIAATVRQIEAPFMAIYTAEKIGTYKPDRNNFLHMLRHLQEHGIAADEILHVSVSLYHDHVPAQAVGLDTCWINRANSVNGTLATPSSFRGGPTPSFRFRSLQQLVNEYK